MLKLYYSPGSCALASHIARADAAAYEAIRVDFATGEQTKPEYVAINPKGRVPALIENAGRQLGIDLSAFHGALS